MAWINEHKRIWRTAMLGLLLVAIAGPWTFDRIHVPAEYPCSPPNFRLQGDFCGLPLSGIKFHILGSILAAGACLFLGLSDFARLHPALWGLWLYLGLALGVLALELLPFTANRRDTLK